MQGSLLVLGFLASGDERVLRDVDRFDVYLVVVDSHRGERARHLFLKTQTQHQQLMHEKHALVNDDVIIVTARTCTSGHVSVSSRMTTAERSGVAGTSVYL